MPASSRVEEADVSRRGGMVQLGAKAAVVAVLVAVGLQAGPALAARVHRTRFAQGSTAPKPKSKPKSKPNPEPVSGPVPSPLAPKLPMLAPGAQGAAVLTLQHRLQALGYWLGTANGNYNLDTTQAVTALQKAANIQRDGVFGPQTQKALDAGIEPKALSKTGKVIEVNLKTQLVLIVDNGKVDDVLDTSTGGGYTYVERGQTDVAITPTGHYQVYSQVDGWDKSPLGELWRPKYFNGGDAIHGYEDVPSYPASHGCVRVSIDAANWIWSNNVAPIGRAVWVYS